MQCESQTSTSWGQAMLERRINGPVLWKLHGRRAYDIEAGSKPLESCLYEKQAQPNSKGTTQRHVKAADNCQQETQVSFARQQKEIDR